MSEPVAFLLVWCLVGLVCLIICERMQVGDGREDLTVGIVLQFLLVGAPFLIAVLGTLLCEIKVMRRRPTENRQNPQYVEDAEAEVKRWLMTGDGEL